MFSEIDGIIQRYTINYPNINVIITGGDANFFDKGLKNTIFASSDLLMIGLNKILDYNEAYF
jgi:type III pantothenate kinase